MNPPKPIPCFLVLREDITALHPAGHQRAVGILDDQIQLRSGLLRGFLHPLLPAENALV